MPEQEARYGDPEPLAVQARRVIEQGLEGWRGLAMLVPVMAQVTEGLRAEVVALRAEMAEMRKWREGQTGDGR